MRSPSRRLLIPRPHWQPSLAALGALTLAVAVAGAMAPAASAQTNLLANGGFSAGSTSGWTCSASDTVVTSPAYDSAAYALSGTPADSGYAECSQVVSVQPSSSYTLAGWVEGDYVYLGAGRADRAGDHRDHVLVGVTVLDRAVRHGHRLLR